MKPFVRELVLWVLATIATEIVLTAARRTDLGRTLLGDP